MSKAGGGGGGGKRGGGGRTPAGMAGAAPTGVSTLAIDRSDEVDMKNLPLPNEGKGVYTAGPQAQQLPKKQQESILAYSGGQVKGGERFAGINAEKLNKVLYDKGGANYIKMSDPDKYKRMMDFKAELNSSLSNAAKYQGETYRVVGNYDAGKAVGRQGLAERFKAGEVAHFDEFISSAHSAESVFSYKSASSAQMRFKITGKSGVNIERVSTYGSAETEVLFGSGKNFMVTSKKWNTVRQNWDISMTEI